MIESIEINNFQSHKHTVIEFDAGLNVIVGATDSGKSSILRALLWLLTNKPSGDKFRSTWGGDTSVVLTLDGAKVTRFKGKGGDAYRIKKQGKKEKELKAFGTGVPDVIEKFLQLDEVNVQRQLDNVFLLSESPGKVAQFFNKVANLEKIDLSISNINSEINKTKHQISFNEDAIKEKQDELANYQQLPEIEKIYKNAKRLSEKANALEREVEDAQSVIEEIKRVQVAISLYNETLQHEPLVNEVMELNDKRTVAYNEYSALRAVLTNIKDIKEKIDNQVDYTTAEATIYAVEVLMQDKASIRKEVMSLKELLLKIDSMETKLSVSEDELKRLEKQWHELKGTECPICGNKIK